MPTPIGIDFGTTNSCVAILRGRQPRVVPNAEGQMTTPSVVALLDGGRRVVGAAAKRQSITNPERTIGSVKRFLGRTFAEAEGQHRAVPFALVDEDGSVRIGADGSVFAPEELAALVLRKLREDVEQYLGEPAGDAVITVPAYFNDAQRQAVKDAASIAGLNVVRLLNEPTAAALAYGFDQPDRKQAKVVVFDLGGGTFDVSLLDVRGGIFQVKATSGDNHLGGDDFDQAIVEWLLKEVRSESGVDLAGDPLALQRLYEEAERAKKDLTALPETEINLPFLAAGQDGPVHLQRTFGRAQFEKLVRHLLDRLAEPIRYCLEQAGLTADQIDDVVLVGGMTRSPLVQDEVRAVLGREPHGGVNPDEAVALGAAIQAGALAGDVSDVVLLDVTPLSLGVEVKSGLVQRLIAANSPLPAKATSVFTTASDDQTSVEVRVMQGERELARDNRPLGVLQLAGIEPQPAGTPRIDVSFELTGEGLLRACVRDVASGNERLLELRSQTALSAEEVERLRGEADAYAQTDREARAAAELRQTLETLAGELADLLERGVISGAAAEPLRRVLSQINDGISGDVDIDTLRTLHEELEFAAGEAHRALQG